MTLLLHDNSDMWRMMASLPDCPWSPHCPMSAVSGTAFPRPGPRHQTRNTRTPEPGSVRTRSSGEYSRQKMARGQQTF